MPDGDASPRPFSADRSNTILYCEHWSATVDFYRSVLRFPVKFENDWFVEFAITDASFLSIADTARATIESAGGHGITISWRVDDVDAARAALDALGVAVSPSIRRWNSTAVLFEDPEGHRIELWAPST